MSIRQIAKMEKLSIATVSLALRDHPRISMATRSRVKAAARRSGYSVNPKITQMMGAIRQGTGEGSRGCLGLISLYDSQRPWEQSMHLSRIHDGMTRRATVLGYRLEPMWLRAPGMTPRRFKSILETRRIEGLLCLGSAEVDESLPDEFQHYAIVTQGVSIRTSLHRVISNAYADTLNVLNRLRDLGYRRPGLVLSDYEHERDSHAHLSAYLGWCHEHFGPNDALPVLTDAGMKEDKLLPWIRRCRPDAIICVHRQECVRDLCETLRRNKLSVPADIGVAAVSQVLDDPALSGLAENQHLIGAWAVELLVARIMNRDLGIPARPRVEMVDGVWREGKTLRRITPAKVNV
jgi:LacI family transcriptional regulator